MSLAQPPTPVFDAEFRSRLRELLAWRRDVRKFQREPLPAGMVDHFIELANLAPSVGLSQPWRFVTVDDPGRRSAVRRNFERANASALAAQTPDRSALYARLKLAGLDDAPCHLAVFADPGTAQGHGLGRRTMRETVEYSTVAAIHTLWLVARAEGVGMGWVSILDPAELAAALDLPPEWTFVGYFCLGYPQQEDDVPALERVAWERRRMASQFIIRR